MRILIFTQGPWGDRISRNIKDRSPQEWQVKIIDLPRALPALIDDPEDIITGTLPQTDLILFMGQSPQAPQLIPDLAQMTGPRGVIVPIDNSAWVPPGLKNQINNDLVRMGVPAVFPKTFCTLTKNTYGYGSHTESYKNEVISAFAQHFGKPKLEIQIDPETGKIKAAEVRRGAPCGSTHHTAKAITGISASEAVPKAGLIAHQFPCQASMQPEEIDKGLIEPLMMVSGYVVNDEVKAALDQVDI